MKANLKKIIATILSLILVFALAGCSEKTTKKSAGKCTISIECRTILDNMDKLDDGVKDFIPKDGIIMEKKEVEFEEDDSVYDVLKRELDNEKILMEASFTGKSVYIEGIDNIYEFSCGDLSGWQYSVNGEFPGKSCSDYKLENNDVIEWRYTCELGEDLKN